MSAVDDKHRRCGPLYPLRILKDIKPERGLAGMRTKWFYDIFTFVGSIIRSKGSCMKDMMEEVLAASEGTNGKFVSKKHAD